MVAVYFSILSFSWGAYTLIEYGYKHSQRNHSPVTQMTIIVLCYILYGIYILISVPATIVTYIFSKVISYRAKRIQNFDDVRQIVLYNYITVVLIIAIEQKLLLVHKATEWIGLRIRLNQYAADLFLLMGIIVGIIRTCNYFVLENQYRRGKKKVKTEVTQEKENVVSRENIKKRMNDLAYDYMYKRKTLFKIQLLALVAFFFYVMLCNYPYFAENRGDIVNVITCYTLIILYLDKRKEYGDILKMQSEEND